MFASTNLLVRSRRLRVGVAAAAIVVVAAGLLVAGRGSSSPATAAPAAAAVLDVPTTSDVLVFVSGAVEHPGLYRLAPGARGSDAIAAAGGLLPTANLGKLPNLAAKVHDGRQLNVPFIGSSGSSSSGKLDLNSATPDELAAIPGMPAGLPQAIVEYRTTWGGFTSMSDLVNVLGVDRPTETALAHYLTVIPAAP